MSHDTLVLLAKTFGPIWMLGFLLIVAIRAWAPSRKAAPVSALTIAIGILGCRWRKWSMMSSPLAPSPR